MILVSDPVRAMALAQALTEQPVMANHAHGLWGYHGTTPGGAELNVQAGGIGGPSAVAVLADLAELGVRRVVRVGACVALDPRVTLGEPVVAREEAGSHRAGSRAGAGLAASLAPGAARVETGRSPVFPGECFPEDADVCDLETLDLLRAAMLLSVDLGAILVPDRHRTGSPIETTSLEAAIEGAAEAAENVL